MFGLIKWIIILLIIGSIWFFYDVATKLSPSEKREFKKDAIEAIDHGNTEPLGSKLKEKFDERKENVFEIIKQKLHRLIDKWGDEENN
ncbi:MAG: hypothetical protein H6731_03070 [Myxococcales bacterium]|nr:MAG: hypothetical protein H6731_03070 [Myxococcales bacterium]